ncbi:MAG: MotA/TolQ/ExbB proton channel family protein [Myxococcales bacterium]|nr:MotA/TolQ/ExbB proton channel family protein [Myxococcales bacterium]
MIEALIAEARRSIADGGFVMPPLVLAAAALWYALGWRALTLIRGARGDVAHLLAADRPPRFGVLGQAFAALAPLRGAGYSAEDLDALIEERLATLHRTLRGYRPLVSGLVMTAPLAGLLGTVSGMIETFDGLGDGALFAATGGVAGGISQALLTTQMGLLVAVPGVIVGRYLDRRQHMLEDDLSRLRTLLVEGAR